MRITSKGQVTIPKAIRDQAGLLPHCEVEFEYDQGTVVLRPVEPRQAVAKRRLAALKGSLRHLRMSTDEIMALTRGDD